MFLGQLEPVLHDGHERRGLVRPLESGERLAHIINAGRACRVQPPQLVGRDLLASVSRDQRAHDADDLRTRRHAGVVQHRPGGSVHYFLRGLDLFGHAHAGPMPSTAAPVEHPVRQVVGLQHRADGAHHAVVHQRDNRLHLVHTLGQFFGLVAVGRLKRGAGDLAGEVPHVKLLFVLRFVRVALLQIDLVRPLFDDLHDGRLDPARPAQARQLGGQHPVVLESVAPTVDVLAATRGRVEIPRVHPARRRLDLLDDFQRHSAGLRIAAQHAGLARLGDRPMNHARANARTVEDHLPHFGRVLVLHHPVVDAGTSLLGRLLGLLNLVLGQVFHGNRLTVRPRHRLACDLLGRCGILGRAGQLRHRGGLEGERLAVHRQRGFADLGSARVHVARCHHHKRGRLRAVGRVRLLDEPAFHRHRLGPLGGHEVVAGQVVNAQVRFFAVVPGRFDAGFLARCHSLVAQFGDVRGQPVQTVGAFGLRALNLGPYFFGQVLQVCRVHALPSAFAASRSLLRWLLALVPSQNCTMACSTPLTTAPMTML